MTNRLRSTLRILFYCVGLLITLANTTRLAAQPGFFNFNYNGPDSIIVGVDCNKALQGNIPNPIVTSTIGATITMSMFDDVASGFPFNQLFTAGETAHVYWFVKDNMGHSHSFEFFIRFVDRTPPVFNLTGIGDTLYFASVAEIPLAPPIIPIADNCTSFNTTFMETTRPDTCLAGTFTRTWTATDLAGNKSTFKQTIIIAADNTPPTITFPPQNGSAPCNVLNTAYPAWRAAQMAAFTAQDPSGIKSLTNNGPASFPPGCKVPLTVTFKATDNCNLMIATTAVFTTSDSQGPVVVVAPKDTVVYCSPGGDHLVKLNEWINKRAYSQVFDSCSTPMTYSMKRSNVLVDSAGVVAAFWAAFDNACGTQLVGSNLVNKVSAFVTVDFFAKDACGNETSVGKRTFAAVDTLPPVITGTNTTEECGGGNDQSVLQGWINAKANATFLDDCSTAFWTGYSFTTSNGQSGSGTFNSGPYPTIVANNCNWFTDVTFFASDECGNASSKTLRFRIVDTTPPIFTGLAPNITVYCPQPLPTVPAATITDNCDLSMAISFTRVYKDSICAGSYTVLTTWNATDDCGNTATITQNIFVQDTTRPVFTLVPIGLFMRCDTFALPPVPVQGMNINATDICSTVVSITTTASSTQNPNPNLCGHYSYNITRTFTATDQCGNTRTATQLISVIDNQPPVPGGILDTTALCSALMPFPAPAPIAVDACAGSTAPPVYGSTQTIPGACAGQYTLKLNWVASDVCGNQTSFQQTVHVVDTVAPVLSNIPVNITVECNAIPDPPNSSSFNGADNCAASVAVSLAEIEIRNPNLNSCDHWTNYTLRRQWTTTDDCGNARTYTQNIQIVDTTPPVLVAPAAITLPNDMGNCGTTIPIPAPQSVFDLCTSGTNMVSLKDTMPITGVMGQTVPVDTMVFLFSVPNSLPLQPAIGNVVLGIYIEMADADGAQEYFNIYGENGVFLDTTARTTNPCIATPSYKAVTITAAQFNDWASDGDLVITLAPNGFGANAINLICPGMVRLNLDYSYSSQQVPLTLTYTLDGGPAANFPPPGATFLGVGAHTVVYTATDCVNNSSTASVQIQVNDIQPPAITAPAPIIAYVGPAICSTAVKLPFPTITENCRMSGTIMQSSVIYPLSFITDPDAPGLIPADVIMSIPALTPNAVGNGVLSIKFKGDNDGPREFFNIIQGANQITTTNLSTPAGTCQDTIVTSIAVSPLAINTWAASGMAVFRAETNTNPGPLFNFDFINLCGPQLPNGTDGISFIQLMLQYNYAIVNFKIKKGATIVASGAVVGTQTMVNLAPGAYTVEYTTTDNAGLIGMTTFPLTVLDTIKPLAKCLPNLTVKVNPSGLNDFVLQPAAINNGSTDNCPGGLTFSMPATIFKCEQAGNSYIVNLSVTDASGNISMCSTIVKVESVLPLPSFDPVCEGDTLQLYTNPPAPASAFSFNWTGPSFSVTQQNPARYNAPLSFQGLYTVTISGTTGCTASGSVTVNFANLAVPDISVSGGVGAFCQGQNIILNTPTNPNNPQDVNYLWYADASPSPILLATTTTNTYTIFQPSPGQYRFFVKVKIKECLTPNSIYITVNVYSRPAALVGNDSLSICAGDLLALSTPISAPGLTYLWTGPSLSGFTSPFQNPTVTNAATPVNAGVYTLKTFQNGCESIPADTTFVTIRYTPPKPTIINTLQACVGNTFTFWASNGGGIVVAYEWQHPVLGSFTTLISQFPIPNVNATHCGKWKVRTMSAAGCFSPWSDEVDFCPQAYPNLIAGANSPVCAGFPVSLTAMDSIPGLPLIYTWTLPNNNQIPGPNPTIAPAQNGIYRVIAQTSFMCADTAFVTVQVTAPPVITGIAKMSPICVDSLSNACLMPSFTSPYGNVSFMWTKVGAPGFMDNNKDLCFTPVAFANNGTYSLVIKDSLGCFSTPAFDSITVLPYVKVPKLTLTPTPVCAGGTVTLMVTNSSDYNGGTTPEYHWITPQGTDTFTSASILVLTNVTVAQSGNYKVYVKKGACQSVFSDIKTLVVNPIPPTPVATSNQPLCIGSTLLLAANAIPGATYSWIGTNFASADKDPVRSNVLASFEGTYTVHVVVNGCASGTSTVYVDVMVPPATPIIALPAQTRICLDSSITEFIRVSNQVFGAFYSWIDLENPGDTLQHSTNHFLNYGNLPSTALTPGLHRFQVSAWKQDNPNGEGCSTVWSNIVSVFFDTIPNVIAATDPSHPACVTPSSKITLQAVPPSNGITGTWASVGSPAGSVEDPFFPTTQFVGIAGNTYTFSWCLTNGGCANFSCTNLTITAVPPETAKAGVDQYICSGTNVSLNAMQGLHSPGSWSQLNQIGVAVADSLEPMSPVTGLNPGNQYFFTWTLEDIGCGAASDMVSIYYYSGKPNITGDPFNCTGSDCSNLQSQGLRNWETGKWTGQPNTTLTFTPDNDPITTVCKLVPGINTVFFEINNGVCGSNSRDTFEITYEIFPKANNDAVTVPFGTATTFQVLTNDILPTDPPNVTIITNPMNGTVTANNSNGSFTYRPFSGFSGSDALVYSICNLKCGTTACSNATVFFTVGVAGVCDIPTIITPNEDGFNDEFKIPADCYFFGEGQSNLAEVTIFNQWGDHVFNDKAFLPSSAWDGRYNGERLPAGTYYWVVKFEAEDRARSGFLLIQY